MDIHSLDRFIEAQERMYAVALEEIKSGLKRSHWMWYIFPTDFDIISVDKLYLLCYTALVYKVNREEALLWELLHCFVRCQEL